MNKQFVVQLECKMLKKTQTQLLYLNQCICIFMHNSMKYHYLPCSFLSCLFFSSSCISFFPLNKSYIFTTDKCLSMHGWITQVGSCREASEELDLKTQFLTE